jgi:hypothetical protein
MGRPTPISGKIAFVADGADDKFKIVATSVSKCAASAAEDCEYTQAKPLETFHQVYYAETSSSFCYMPFRTCNSSVLPLRWHGKTTQALPGISSLPPQLECFEVLFTLICI